MFKALFLSAILGVSDAMMLRDVAEAPKKKPPKPKSSSSIPSSAPSAQPSSAAALCTDTWYCPGTECLPIVNNCLSVVSLQASCTGTDSMTWGYAPNWNTYSFPCDDMDVTTFDLEAVCNENELAFAATPASSVSRTFTISWVPVTTGTCSPIDWYD
jgi:hypothetical protein